MSNRSLAYPEWLALHLMLVVGCAFIFHEMYWMWIFSRRYGDLIFECLLYSTFITFVGTIAYWLEMRPGLWFTVAGHLTVPMVYIAFAITQISVGHKLSEDPLFTNVYVHIHLAGNIGAALCAFLWGGRALEQAEGIKFKWLPCRKG